MIRCPLPPCKVLCLGKSLGILHRLCYDICQAAPNLRLFWSPMRACHPKQSECPENQTAYRLFILTYLCIRRNPPFCEKRFPDDAASGCFNSFLTLMRPQDAIRIDRITGTPGQGDRRLDETVPTSFGLQSGLGINPTLASTQLLARRSGSGAASSTTISCSPA